MLLSHPEYRPFAAYAKLAMIEHTVCGKIGISFAAYLRGPVLHVDISARGVDPLSEIAPETLTACPTLCRSGSQTLGMPFALPNRF